MVSNNTKRIYERFPTIEERRAYYRAKYAKNKESMLAYNEKHREENKQRAKDWYQEHKNDPTYLERVVSDSFMEAHRESARRSYHRRMEDPAYRERLARQASERYRRKRDGLT